MISKELHNEQKGSWLKVLTSRFPLRDKETLKILDIGTGPGFFAMILAEEGYHVTAIDYTEAMIYKAKTNVAIREKEIRKELSSYITFIHGGLNLASANGNHGFDRGANSIAWVMIRFMIILVPVVFLACGLTKGNWSQAFLFALSVSVGLTPELLPMVVNACLARGSYSMGKKQTIVKNINAEFWKYGHSLRG